MKKLATKESLLEYFNSKKDKSGNVESSLLEISKALGYKSSSATNCIREFISQLKEEGKIIEICKSKKCTMWNIPAPIEEKTYKNIPLENLEEDLYRYIIANAKNKSFEMTFDDLKLVFNTTERDLKKALIRLQIDKKVFTPTITDGKILSYADYEYGKEMHNKAVSQREEEDKKKEEELKIQEEQIKSQTKQHLKENRTKFIEKKSIRKTPEYYNLKSNNDIDKEKEKSSEKEIINNIIDKADDKVDDCSVNIEPSNIAAPKEIIETPNKDNIDTTGNLRIFYSPRGKAIPITDIADVLGIDNKTIYALINRNMDMFEDYIMEADIKIKGHNLKSLTRDGVIGLLFLLNHHRSHKKEELLKFKKWAMKTLGDVIDGKLIYSSNEKYNSTLNYTDKEIEDMLTEIKTKYISMKQSVEEHKEKDRLSIVRFEQLKEQNNALIARTVALSNRAMDIK